MTQIEMENLGLREEIRTLLREKAMLIVAAKMGLECAEHYRKGEWDTTKNYRKIKSILVEIGVINDAAAINHADHP